MKMYDKKTASTVEAIEFYADGKVLVYHPLMGGNGWTTIPLKRLIPIDYAQELINATEKAKIANIKNRIKMCYAEWETTDGKIFDELNDAIEHEKYLMDTK